MGKQTIRPDLAKNRLYIVSEGFFSDQEILKGYDQVTNALAKLKPDFVCISDVSTFKPTTSFGVQKQQELVKELVKKGVKKIIQIQSKNSLTEMQVNRIAKHDVNDLVLYVSSMGEAEQLADTL